MDHVQLFINGALVYEQPATGATPPPNPTGPTGPAQPPIDTTPPPADVINLGPFSVTGGPSENGVASMAPGYTYCRSQELSDKTNTFQFLSGYLTGFELPAYEAWVSSTPGGMPLPFPGCERQELSGANVASCVINPMQLKGAGIFTIYFNLRASGWTGRYMQRSP